MEPERWQAIERLYHAALERAPAERAAFLEAACAGDESLRREVVSFIAAGDQVGSFLEPPPDALDETVADAAQPSVIGQTLGHYRIVSLLGKGGMGEVYLGEDTTLRRKVALKLLPAAFIADQARLRRFEQEARAASALNHPNIITIHEISQADGLHYLVTEYIEGETLRQRMAAERMKPSEAVELAVQVASALQAAHAAGIIHRDIKPENVMVRPDGLVKVLDFGLAKLTEVRSAESGARKEENAETLWQAEPKTPHSTEPGLVLGTASYMSPEQARGQRVDARSDIFSLGVVLYEMLAGRAPFAGVNALDVIGAILNREPAPLGQHAPAELQRIVSQALRKDREQRYQHSKDLWLDLTALRREAATNEVAAARTTSSAAIIIGEIKRHKLGVGVALTILVAAVAGLAFGLYRLNGPQQAPNRGPGTAPRVVPFTSFSGNEASPTFSPDGNQIAFMWNGEKEENTDIYVKLIDAGAPLRLTTHPDADLSPAWSPDGRHIAFIRVSESDRGIFLVPALGGTERKLSTTSTDGPDISSRLSFSSDGTRLSWSPDGKFLAFSARATPQEPPSIFLLSVETLEKRQLLTPPPSSIWGDENPAFSPDGQTLVFVRWIGTDSNDLYRVPVAGGEPQRLTFDNQRIGGLSWTLDGRELIFSSDRGGTYGLWRMPSTGGTPERLAAGGENGSGPVISRQGNRLAWAQSVSDSDIWRIELANPVPARFIASTREDRNPQFSPDGKRIALESGRAGSMDVWVCDSAGLNCTQLTFFGGPTTGSPRWSPDGQRLAFDSIQQNNKDIYVVGIEGGKPRRLTTEASDEVRPSWSRDGQWIYFGSNRTGDWQVWKLPAEGGQAVQVTRQRGREAFEAPDSKFVYYTQGHGPTSLWRVPVAGGAEVRVLEQVVHGSWVALERGIYYVNHRATPRQAIEFLNFATGQVTRLVTLEKPHGGVGLNLSPDGHWLLYSQVNQVGSDIMLMENFR